MREAQSDLGTSFALSSYKFFLTGTSTPANVYQDGALTTPFSPTGVVTADAFGRFPAIWLDPSVIYRVQFFNSSAVQQWQNDPYVSTLSTFGTSSLSAFGPKIAATGEVTIPAPNTGGTGISLTLNSGSQGSAALQISAQLPGNSALIINNSATTGAQTATFTAANKPGTATSTPAGWLPITCDGVQYYTPIWHGNNFTPYVAQPTALGEVISAISVTFGGTGLTTASGGTAIPSNWFTPVLTGVGAGYWINITKNGGQLSGQAFIPSPSNLVTVAPSGGAYTGGTLSTGNFSGNTASNYTLILSTGQVITGCTFTNGSTTFTCPATAIAGTPNNFITVTIDSVWANITAGGILILNNTGTPVSGTYQLSTSAGGSPVVASGTITILGNTGPQSPTYSVSTPLTLNGNGTATAGSGATSSWFSPTTGSIGGDFYINITRTGGTVGYTFGAALGAWTNITSGGLVIPISGSGATSIPNVTGSYLLASDAAGVNQLGSGNITITGSVTRTYSGPATNATETAPAGCTSVTIKLQGGGSFGYVTTGGSGFGGSGGGQSVTTVPISPGQTLKYTLANGQGFNLNNNSQGQPGASGSVSSGTKTITTMSCTAAVGGLLGSAGAAGTASGGNVSNTNGSIGLVSGVGGAGGDGGTGGTVGNTGSTACAGAGRASPGAIAGNTPFVTFIYT